MIKVAFVGERFREQVDAGSRELAGLEVVLRGEPLAAVERRAKSLRPTVLVLSLEELPAEPIPKLDQLLSDSGAELAVVVYAYARRALVDALMAHPKLRPVQGPLSMSNLRCQLLQLVVKDILRSGPPPADARLLECPTCGSRVDERALQARG